MQLVVIDRTHDDPLMHQLLIEQLGTIGKVDTEKIGNRGDVEQAPLIAVLTQPLEAIEVILDAVGHEFIIEQALLRGQ